MTRPRTPTAGPAVLLLALLLVVCAACTGGGTRGTDDGGPGGTAAGSAAPGDVTGHIVVASGRDVTGKNGIRQQLIDAWNLREQRGNSGFRARLVELPGSADEQRSQLLGALQSRSAAYDVVNLDVTWVPEFATADLIEPLPRNLVDADIIPSVAGTAWWDGEVYAVPFNSDVGLLYYRRDYLKRAGVERLDLGSDLKWNELRGLVEALDAESVPDAYEKGWTTQLAAYEGRTVNAVEAFASAVPGLELVDEKGRYTGDVDELTDGIAELRRRTETAYTLQDAHSSDEDASLSDFAEGRTAFLRHWPSEYRTLYRTFSEGRLGVAPLPGRAVLGGQNLAVTGVSQRKSKAAELIRFLTGKESERCLLEAGFAATRASAYEGGERCTVVGPGPSVSPTGEGADPVPRDAGGRPAYARDILLPALRKAVHRPRTPLYGAFTQTFITRLGPLHGDGAPSDEVLAEQLDKALRKALPR
ncbi:extracellular solute-binding protein [Streptomyces sp. KMM 9044]|uniref:extracellular solute-binding protein n=1 Tax=Streptomyces sp. KMM 9044 TaxID=2744474 RepID=UPI002151FA72|nr:extracellular solute-binding protein [Streptomyces sp. KMM 9044]WAX79197.1 extracellular solute-binding protein [Streptomyces sp. KMM 9044]